jgi:hypothetical protein
MVGQEEKFSLLLFEIFIFVLLTSQRTNSKGCLKRIQGLAEQKKISKESNKLGSEIENSSDCYVNMVSHRSIKQIISCKLSVNRKKA